MFRQEEDLVTGSYVGWRNAAIVGSGLVAFLSDLERFRQVVVEVGEVGSELPSVEGGYIEFGVDVKGRVVTLIGKERGYAS